MAIIKDYRGEYDVAAVKVNFSNGDQRIYSGCKPLIVPNNYPSDNFPRKGNLIALDMDGNGHKQYRVLKIRGTVAEVLGMTNLTEMSYNSSSKTVICDGGTEAQAYAGSDLDNYLNNTWYNSLSDEAKAAIVPKDIVQKMYGTSWKVDTTATYIGIASDGDDYKIVLKDHTRVGKRYVYALDCEEIVNYTGNGANNLTATNIWRMFWNTTTSSNDKYILLRSAATVSDRTLHVHSTSGYIWWASINVSYAVRPAFQIDLDKINWSIV